MTEKQQDETIKSRILGLLQKGYTRSQLINDFNFAERTVDSAIKEYRELEGDDPQESKKGSDPEEKGLALPAKLDSKQVIVPEYLIQHLSFIDGDKKQAAVDMVLIWEAARRSVMEDVVILQGIAEAQSKMTETQLNILRAAKGESGEVAQQAAEQAVANLGRQVVEVVREQAVVQSPNPLAAMMVNTMQPYFQQLIANLMGAVMRSPGQLGQPQLGAQPVPGNQPPGVVPPFGTQEATEDEVKEAFNE